MKGWLVVLIGIVVAAAAAFALLTTDSEPEGRGKPPSGDIRDESREAMRELLRDAEGPR